MAELDDEELTFTGPGAEDVDLSDETQDFRFLAQLTGAAAPKIPKRGEKDFEPHATALQSDTLAASRAAMHTALSTPRIHKPKQHNVAIYHADSNMAYIYRPKGNFGRTMGMSKGDTLWLLPEEALYLLERGSLDVRWPMDPEQDAAERQQDATEREQGVAEREQDVTEREPDVAQREPDAAEREPDTAETDPATGKVEEDRGVPMSLQGAYAAFIGLERVRGGKLTLEMFVVYSALKRAGYAVLRADSWDDDRPPPDPQAMQIGLLSRLRQWWLSSGRHLPDKQLVQGPLVKPGLYRTYDDVYRLLEIIPAHDQQTPPRFSLPADLDNPFRVVYHIWKPNTPFKKSSPGPPDFRIAIVNARKTSVPTLSQLNDLLATTPYDPPPESLKSVAAKLKHGYRNVILAVVDQGVTSYLRLADAGFSHQKLYERRREGGNKRGGRGRGRGRGGRGG